MSRVFLLTLSIFALGCSWLVADEKDRLASGPSVGAFMPAPFECLNVTGAAKGRQHCLVCKFELSPAVMIFTRDRPAEKNPAIDKLVAQLDEVAEEFKDREFSIGVIVLTPDCKDSTNNTGEVNSTKIIEETKKRQALIKRLEARGGTLKHAIVACYLPEGPKGYQLNARADATILFYERMKIQEKWVFGADGLQDRDVEMIVKRVRDAMPIKKKAPENPKAE